LTKTGWRSKTHLVGGCVDGLGDGAGFGDLGDLGFGHGLRIEGGERRVGMTSALNGAARGSGLAARIGRIASGDRIGCGSPDRSRLPREGSDPGLGCRATRRRTGLEERRG